MLVLLKLNLKRLTWQQDNVSIIFMITEVGTKKECGNFMWQNVLLTVISFFFFGVKFYKDEIWKLNPFFGLKKKYLYY